MNLELVKQSLQGRINGAVEMLEEAMLKHEQVDIPAVETLNNGLYTRQITILAGTLLTGRVWLEDYVDIMVSGRIVVATPEGTKELSGFNILDGAAGRKRAGYAIEDTVWLTVHRTEASTIDNLLEAMSTFSMHEYEVKIAQLDYKYVFSEYQDVIDSVVYNVEDLRDLPAEFAEWVEIGQSDIAGLGMFAKKDFYPGEHVGPARLAQYRTTLGRYVNHSCLPNVKTITIGDHIAMVAIKYIKCGDELLSNYVHTVTGEN